MAVIEELTHVYTVEDLLAHCEAVIEKDLLNYRQSSEPHPAVCALLESALESVRIANFEYYASFK